MQLFIEAYKFFHCAPSANWVNSGQGDAQPT